MDNLQPNSVAHGSFIVTIDPPDITEQEKEENDEQAQLAVLRDHPAPLEAHLDLERLTREDSTPEELKAFVPLLLGRLIEQYDPLAKPYLCHALDASIGKIIEDAKAKAKAICAHACRVNS
jgi:hypothetical protein